MQVKHNRQCMLTSKMTTCFVFDEFSLLFSISREAFDTLLDDYQFYPKSQHFCSFCEEDVGVKQITGFHNSTFFSDLFMCHKCFHKIKDKIDDES